MEHSHQHHVRLQWVLSTLCGALLVTGGYLLYINFEQRDKITMLLEERNHFLQLSTEYRQQYESALNTASELRTELTDVREDLGRLADDYRDEQNRNEAFEAQIRDLAGTVGTLDRLAQIDEELLQKYSRVSFLNENYIPRQLTQIDARYVHPSADDEYFLADAYGHLRDLLRAADRADLDLQILSAYRSFEYQTELKGRYLVTYGEGANTFSADQGFSEHQLGTSVDFTTSTLGGALNEQFAGTPEYAWLLENAHRYGFILSYPEGNQFYVFEPWHWRFVGEDLARDLKRDGAHFYDWDQRKINEYLIRIFE
jgi:D-alanyl-D-alanine carboxypeptidase